MIGVKTMFIRTGGCDYRCTRCDSMHAVEPRAVKANARWMEPKAILEELGELTGLNTCNWVTISGGNPAMWEELDEVVGRLQAVGIKVAVETQGTIWRPWIAKCDQVTISPKGPGMGEKFEEAKFRNFLLNLGGVKNKCVKVVVFDQQDLEFIVNQVDPILNQYCWSTEDRYISIGNSYQPVLGEDMKLHDQREDPNSFLNLVDDIPGALLKDFRSLLEMDILPDWRLTDWKVLPQLHVLVWANKAEV